MSIEGRLHRRAFLELGTAGAVGLLGGACSRQKAPAFTGGIVGASASTGHLLRDGPLPAASEQREADVIVIGGGVAGLAALRHLHSAGVKDAVLLELESSVGGNAQCGQNRVSAYPWGAHYVPLPNDEATDVIELFEELRLITGRDRDGRRIHDERSLCADPMERLFTRGRWIEGLVPALGLSADDERERAAFHAEMEVYRKAVGRDGAPAFAIPMERSSRDPQWLALDQLTMAQWLDAKGWCSPALRWHVDYSCRDDYGAGIAHVSAWAGIHYFASRRGVAANAESDAVLTWPEGNGWLVRQMAEPLRPRIHTGWLVWKVTPRDSGGVLVEAFDTARKCSVHWQARTAICATPAFISHRLVEGLGPAPALEYSPWMVANLTLRRAPSGRGAPLAWDNVFQDSRSLGYVVATHQSLRSVPGETVLTHYWPLDDGPPAEVRRQMLARSYAEWCELILADLERVHPGLRDDVTQLDVWLWGHGMMRPVPGFLWGGVRERLARRAGDVFFAHSDLSGLALFEEALTRGVQAARDAVNLLS